MTLSHHLVHVVDRQQRTRDNLGGYVETNTVWMWAALLAGNLSTLLQAFTGIDTGKHGRAHGDRLRHELLRVPARVIHHARELTLRLPPGHTLLPEVMADLRALPAPSG